MNKTLIIFSVLITLVCCLKKESNEIKAPGIVDGEIITLKSTVVGKIEKLFIKEGEPVKKGRLLAKINSEKIDNQLQELEIGLRDIAIGSEKLNHKLRFIDATINHLKKQAQRFKRLKDKNSISGEKLENMELKLLEAETSKVDIQKTLESLLVQQEKIQNKQKYLRLLLDEYALLSPVNGTVVEKFVSEGENVFPGTSLVDVLDRSSLYIEVFIEEREISVLKLNQRVTIMVDGIKDQTFPGVVSLFGRKAEFSPKYIISEKERKSLLYQVKINILKHHDVFKIGMPVTVALPVSNQRRVSEKND